MAWRLYWFRTVKDPCDRLWALELSAAFEPDMELSRRSLE